MCVPNVGEADQIGVRNPHQAHRVEVVPVSASPPSLSLRPPKTGLLGLLRKVREELARNREARVALTQRVWAAAIGWIRTDHEHSHIERQSEFGAPQTDERIATWLRYQLQHRHGKVSLRWLPRWLDAALAIWNRLNDPMAAHRPPVSWLRLALATPPRPLPRLDPWREARHDPPERAAPD